MLHLVTEETFAYYNAQIELEYRLRKRELEEGSNPCLKVLSVTFGDRSVQAVQFADDVSVWIRKLNGRSTQRKSKSTGARTVLGRRKTSPPRKFPVSKFPTTPGKAVKVGSNKHSSIRPAIAQSSFANGRRNRKLPTDVRRR